MVEITIFTPTYNRKDTIMRLYRSLNEQTIKCFEWVIVDDGSTDNTYQYLMQIKENASFEMRVYKQRNQGKHAAINKGVSEAKGRLFFIVDSDDYLAENAIEIILQIEKTIHDKQQFCGLAGVRVDPEKALIGTTFSEEYKDCTALERDKYHITGDKAEVYYTNILKKYPFPVFDGETFLTESVVWYRMANDGYKIRWTNSPFYICDYQTGGLSNTTGKCSRNFKGYQLTIRENLSYKQLPYARRLNDLVAYASICQKEQKDTKECAGAINQPTGVIWILGKFGYWGYKVVTALRNRHKGDSAK